MKVFVDDKVYVQKKDLDFIASKGVECPSSVSKRIKEEFPLSGEFKYDFVEFTLQDEVDYFANSDWIIDYNCYCSMTIRALDSAINTVEHERLDYALLRKEGVDVDQAGKEMDKLKHQIWSLFDMILIKQGKLHFPLPQEDKEKTDKGTPKKKAFGSLKKEPKE